MPPVRDFVIALVSSTMEQVLISPLVEAHISFFGLDTG